MTDTLSEAVPLPEVAGLTEEEAERRLIARGPVEEQQTSRSLASIVRANVFTVFNVILVAFGVLTFAFGHFEDALFIAILVANSGIGIYQEWRAKTALDRLAALVAPHATVVRSGEARSVTVDQVVEGDLVQVRMGDQVIADGVVHASEGLMLDESILTGESHAIPRVAGEEVRSGSFVAEGAGAYVVTAVGKDSYAHRLTETAREFRHPRSPLEHQLNRLLIASVAVVIPLGAMLSWALLERQTELNEAVTTAVAAVVTLIPEGLILLVSMTYAIAAMRMARRGALAQQLNAIESIASADVICLDKTGTLTQAALRVVDVIPFDGVERSVAEHAFARYAASSPSRNATLEAVGEHLTLTPEQVTAHVPFSSARRWSGITLGDSTFVFGAPEHFALGALAGRVEAEQRQGRRVLAIGTTESALPRQVGPDQGPPAQLRPVGLAVLAERLRPDARETVQFFLEQGVQLKVISGDAPETVAAIARDAGIPVGTPLDGRNLPEDPEELRRVALEATVVGRISPEGKRRLVEALKAAGKYVAMVGDGVNDVPALKAARLGIAQGSGTQMAKSVADIVLVTGEFGAVPAMVAEGRKVLRNLQRVAKLFVTKSAFAAFLILTIGLTAQSYPLLPRHLTLAATLTIGMPGLFLALAPSAGSWNVQGFLREIARFAIPAGTAAGLGVVASYQFARNVLDVDLIESRTVAVTVLIVLGLYFIFVLEATGRVRGRWIGALCIAIFALYWLFVAMSATRGFFELATPTVAIVMCAIGGSAIAILGLALVDERFIPGRAFARGDQEPEPAPAEGSGASQPVP
ncbi:MAG: HAD-IC family P-type ATPase [Thermoleophilia bacterium]